MPKRHHEAPGDHMLVAHSCTKPPRQRHISLFPWWWAHLVLLVGPADAVAYVNVLMAYYQRDGQLVDDNKLLAELARVTLKRWLTLREKVLAHGIARVDNGLWVDDAHLRSIHIQLKTSERQRAIAMTREDAKRRARLIGDRE